MQRAQATPLRVAGLALVAATDPWFGLRLSHAARNVNRNATANALRIIVFLLRVLGDCAGARERHARARGHDS
jgi:hypothetical protein